VNCFSVLTFNYLVLAYRPLNDKRSKYHLIPFYVFEITENQTKYTNLADTYSNHVDTKLIREK